MEEEGDGMDDGMGDGMSEDMDDETDEDPMPTDIGAISFTDPDTGAAMGRATSTPSRCMTTASRSRKTACCSSRPDWCYEEDTEVMVRVTDRYGLSSTGTDHDHHRLR